MQMVAKCPKCDAALPVGVHETPAAMGLLDRVGLFFGSEVQNSLHMVEGEEEGITLGGYVGDPSCDQGGTQRPAATHQAQSQQLAALAQPPAQGALAPAQHYRRLVLRPFLQVAEDEGGPILFG